MSHLKGTIICAVGARFKKYCANVARTLFVDPREVNEELEVKFYVRCRNRRRITLFFFSFRKSYLKS